MSDTLRVAILAFDDVEALDLAGPYEVFTTATRMQLRSAPEQAVPLFQVCCIARSLAPVRMRAGLRVLPDFNFDEAATMDVLIVPGGVVDAAVACDKTRDWIARSSRTAGITASICTGAFLLAASGVLRDERVTTHWEDLADLRRGFPHLEVVEGMRWVDQGRVVTSAGITAGIDMSLHLVERLVSRKLALRTARQMDFAWTGQP